MKNEKIRFEVDYILLGERRFWRFPLLAPRVLKLLSFVLIVLALLQINTLYRSFSVLAVLYVLAAALLRLLVWCAELVRDRWLVHRISGNKIAASALLAAFSRSDIFRAAVLALVLRLYCFCRGVLIFAVPVLFLAASLYIVGSGVSTAVLGSLVCGNLLLFTVAVLFYSAAVCPVRCAVKLTSLEKSGLAGAVKEKITALDTSGFRLLSLRLLPVGTFSAQRIMAGLIYSGSVLGE